MIELDNRSDPGRDPAGPSAFWPAAVLIAVTLGASPLTFGYFNFSVWAPLTIGAMVLLIVVAWSARPAFSRWALAAGAGLGLLLALSAASILWAQSKDSAWTDINRLALYVVVFLIALLAVRERRTARLIVLILGLAALITSVWFPISFLIGGGRDAFVTRRLNSPIGYINGTAGLLIMGIWPWLAYAQSASRRELRALALAAATLIAGTFVLTQSRAVVPAMTLTAVVVLACAPGRTRRAINLILLGAAVALSLHWTLPVYSSGGAAGRDLLPAQSLLRHAGAAILLVSVLAGACSLAVDALAERVAGPRRAVLSRRLGAAMLAAAVLAAGTGLVAGHSWISRQWNSFTALHVDYSASVRFVDASGFRYDLWRVAVHEFRAHPLGGLGAGNYDTEYYRLRRNPEYVVQPHSLELQMLAELGIGGVLALVLFCGAVLGAGFARRGTIAAEDPLVRVAALGVFTAWLIHTSVDWLYDIPGLAGMAMVAAALLVLPVPRRAASAPRSRRAQVGLVGGLAVLTLLAASIGRQYVASRYAASGESQVAHAPGSALGTLRTAARLDPYSLSTLYALASAYARLDQYRQAWDALLVAEQREPSNYVPPALLGDLAFRHGDLGVALTEYRQAERLDPNDPSLQQSSQAVEAAQHS